MTKLLLLTGLLTTTPSIFSPLTSVSKINKNISKINENDKIDLEKINLAKIDINVNEIAKKGETFDQSAVFKKIMAQEIKHSSENKKELTSILKDYILNQNDWDFIEFPSSYPELGETKLENISVMYMGSGNFDGLLSFDIEYSNSKTDKEYLEDLIKITDLGIINNADSKENYEQNIFDAIKNNNKKISFNIKDLIFTDVNYSSAFITTRSDSNYQGSINITYKTNFNFDNNKLISKETHCSSYSTTHSDWDHKETSFDFVLGRNNLINDYKAISFRVSGTTYDNKHWTDSIDAEGEFNGKIGNTTVTLKNINLSEKSNSFWVTQRDYSNVNNMHSWSILSWVWDENKLNVSFETHVKTFASGWNANTAEAKCKLTIDNFKLVE